MGKFYESLEYCQQNTLCHYGVKGMQWGVHTQQPYVPVAQRRAMSEQETAAAVETAQTVAEAPPEKVSSTRKKVIKGLIIGGSIAAVVGGIVAGGVFVAKNPEKVADAYKKIRSSEIFRNKDGSTPAGEALRKKVEAAKKSGLNTSFVNTVEPDRTRVDTVEPDRFEFEKFRYRKFKPERA